MKHNNQTSTKLPVENYQGAIRKALAWLGKRYLLAVPINARAIDHTMFRYHGQRRRWHEGHGTSG